MHRIVSADLAYRTYRDTGIAVLEASEAAINCAFIDASASGLAGEPSPETLADFLGTLCRELDATVLVLDGPQGWKDPGNGLEHARLCERALHTPAKTGIPGVVKPGNYLPFVAFAVAVFDALSARGWPRYAGKVCRECEPVSVESFPMSAWKRLGIPVLPAKARSRPEDLALRLEALQAALPLRLASAPNHDQLQALVAGLGGVGLRESHLIGTHASGVAPYQVDGTWREGFIVNPSWPAGPAAGHRRTA